MARIRPVTWNKDSIHLKILISFSIASFWPSPVHEAVSLEGWGRPFQCDKKLGNSHCLPVVLIPGSWQRARAAGQGSYCIATSLAAAAAENNPGLFTWPPWDFFFCSSTWPTTYQSILASVSSIQGFSSIWKINIPLKIFYIQGIPQ